MRLSKVSTPRPFFYAKEPAQPVAAPPTDILEGRSLPHPRTLFLVLLAMMGGLFGIVGAFQAELYGGLLLPWLWAPVIEEIFKPVGVYLLLIRWPKNLSNQIHIALLAALGGLTFALVESTVYVMVYFSGWTQSEVIFRFTVPVMMHTLSSFVFGMGINRQVFLSLGKGGSLRPRNWGFFLSAMVIHSVYNITVTVLDIIDNI